MHREYSEACYYGSLGTDLSVDDEDSQPDRLFQRRGRGRAPPAGPRENKRPLPSWAAAFLTARGYCYLAGDAVLGVASVLLLGPPGTGAALLFVPFGDAALMPLSEFAAPGVP